MSLNQGQVNLCSWGWLCVLLPAGRRPAADLTAVAGRVRMSTEATMPEGDGRWSSQRPLPHGHFGRASLDKTGLADWTLQC